MTNASLKNYLIRKRGQNEKMQNKHMDIAVSIQKVTELVKNLTSLKKEYGQRICLAEAALNVLHQ